jgi:hypothetical protein
VLVIDVAKVTSELTVSDAEPFSATEALKSLASTDTRSVAKPASWTAAGYTTLVLSVSNALAAAEIIRPNAGVVPSADIGAADKGASPSMATY